MYPRGKQPWYISSKIWAYLFSKWLPIHEEFESTMLRILLEWFYMSEDSHPHTCTHTEYMES